MRKPRLRPLHFGLAAFAAAALFSDPASAQTTPGGPATAPAGARPTPSAPSLRRWVDLQTASLGGRYRVVENSAGDRTASQAQYQTSIRAALRIDAQGRVLVTGSFATGSSGTSSWNNSGVGTGQGTRQHSVKELFVTVAPAQWLAVHAGSMAFARGLSTEATTWDTDFYVMGERVSVKRPRQLYVDEITATFGYVGDVSTPSVFSRWERLGDSNYRQLLAAKKLGRFQVAADYTSHEHVGTARAAVKVGVPEWRLIDSIRYEAYAGVHGGDETGFVVHAEKSLPRRVAFGGGLADIDPAYGALNGDRFGRGRRVYLTGSIGLPADLSVQIWATRAFANDFAVSNRTRVDAVISYNLLSTLRRARMF